MLFIARRKFSSHFTIALIIFAICGYLGLQIAPGWGTPLFADDSVAANDQFLYLPFITVPVPPPEWEQIGDLPPGVERFFDVTICEDTVFASASNGVYQLIGGEQGQWQPVAGFPAISTPQVRLLTSCDRAYAVTIGQGVWQGVLQQDNSWQWTRLATNFDDTDSYSLANRGDHLFVGGGYGIRWNTLPAVLPDSWQGTNITALSVGLSRHIDTHVMMAGVWNQGVFANLGDNNVWAQQGDISDRRVYEAASDGAGIPRLAGTQSRLFVWDGNNWQLAAHEFVNTTFAVLYHNGRFYAGQRNAGVIVSDDGGATWRQMNDGLLMIPEFQVRRFVPHEDYIYIATTSGVWRWSAP